MRVWLDVFDENDNRLGEGPVFAVKNATVKRALDGGGSIRANVVASDARAVAQLVPGRVMKVWGENPDETTRLLGEGVIANWRLTDDPTGIGLTIDGPDILEELKAKNTLLGRIYNQETLLDVCDDLIGLAPGWSVTVDTSIQFDLVDARFDGTNVLKAFIEIAKRYGYHLRHRLSQVEPTRVVRELEIGAFGDDTGLRMHRVETINSATLANPSLLMVQRIQQDKTRESNNYYTVILPLGAGEGTAALTMARSTRTTPYSIQSITGPDGRTLYYISTTNYPTTQYADFTEDPRAVVKVGQYKEVAPLTNSEADIVNAANALYDAAASDLARSSVVQETYQVRVKNVRESILPGSTIHINYLGQIERGADVVTYLNVRGDFTVLSVNEQFNLDSSDVTLEVSNIDRFQKDATELLFDTVDQMRLRTLKPNITVGTPSTYVYDREIAPSFPAEVPIEITDTTLELLRVRLRIKTGPFRSTSQGAADGGDHYHAMFQGGGAAGTGTRYNYASNSSLGNPVAFVVEILSGPNDAVINTFGASGDHTHDPVYGIADDTETPEGITFHFDGNDVTNDLFGAASLAPSGGAINELADAGELADLLNNASGGLRQLHTLEIRCSGGQGRVEVTIERYETTQAVKIS